MGKHFVVECFGVVPCMEWKQMREKRKERDKNKEPKESKKERQEGRKKEKNKRERERERQRQIKRIWKRGRPKKAKEEQMETLKNKQTMPFFRGKNRFFLQWEAKKGKQKKKTKQLKKINKKQKKLNNTPKRAFQLSINFFFFWWVSKIPLFDNLVKKARTTAPWIEVGVKLAFFSGVQESQNWGENGFSCFRSWNGLKTRVFKNWPNLFFGLRPSSFLCFWVSRLDFAKTDSWKSTEFRWNHWKRSAKMPRPKTHFLHTRVRNRQS